MMSNEEKIKECEAKIKFYTNKCNKTKNEVQQAEYTDLIHKYKNLLDSLKIGQMKKEIKDIIDAPCLADKSIKSTSSPISVIDKGTSSIVTF